MIYLLFWLDCPPLLPPPRYAVDNHGISANLSIFAYSDISYYNRSCANHYVIANNGFRIRITFCYCNILINSHIMPNLNITPDDDSI